MAETSAAPGHIWIDNRIIDFYGERIGAYGVAVYAVLARHTDANTRRCYPSTRKISQLVCLSRPTVLKAISKLEEEGLVKVERSRPRLGKREVNVYTLLPVRGGQNALPPVVNDVDQRGKPAIPEQDLINKTQENKGEGPRGEGCRPAHPRDPNLDHPAVKVYRGMCKLTPGETQRAEIAKVVSDMAKWEEVIKRWLLAGYRNANVEGMLDWYRKGIPERGGGNGRNAGGGRPGFQGNKVYDRRESRPPETPEERACREAEWDMLKQSQNRSQHNEA